MKKIASIFFAVSAIILVSGCSSSSDSTPPPTTLTGTAATGAPIVGTVTVKDAKGAVKIVATTNGSFTLDVAGMTPAYLLKVVPDNGTATLYSYASQNGQTVNLTPTTNLAMLLASNNADLGAMYSNWNGATISEAAVKAAEGTVRANLAAEFTAAGLDLSAVDLFTTPFTADGTGIDGVMDNLSIAVDFPNGTYTFADSNGTTFDESATPPAPAGAISILTVKGASHTLDGTYRTACYSGRVDAVTITGSAWVNSSSIYADNICSGSPSSTAAMTATIAKGAEKQISGWVQGSGVAPMKADGSGPLSDTETVTGFTLSNISVADPGGIFGDFTTPASGTTFTGFYVFDDTAGGGSYVMYRDDDGSFASASDPFVSAGSGSGSTGGSGGSGSTGGSGGGSSFALSAETFSGGGAIELADTSWSSNCYNDGTDDKMDTINITGTASVSILSNTYTSGSNCVSWTGGASITGDFTTSVSSASITNWIDSSSIATSAPQKQDASGALPDASGYTLRTITITSATDASLVGAVDTFAFIVDDTSTPSTVYRVLDVGGDTKGIAIPLY